MSRGVTGLGEILVEMVQELVVFEGPEQQIQVIASLRFAPHVF